MANFVAQGDLRGGRMALELAWSGPGEQPGLVLPTEPPFPDPSPVAPSFRVVRRRFAFPTGAEDGLTLFDFADLFADANTPWGILDRRRWLTTNTAREGGLAEAELVLFTKVVATAPSRAVFAIYDASPNPAWRTFAIEAVTRVVESGDGAVIEIFRDTGGGVEASAGVLAVAGRHLTWTAAGQSAIGVDFDLPEVHRTESVVGASDPGAVTWTTRLTDGSEIRTIQFEETRNDDTGDVTRSMKVVDAEPSSKGAGAGGDSTSPGPANRAPGLTPATTYYYAIFSTLPTGDFAGRAALTASDMATGDYAFGDRLYASIPGVHRLYDEPTGETTGPGQLRRFLQTAGAGLDAAYTLGEGLTSLHDVNNVDAKFLPDLARWIGWEPDQTLPDQLKRTDILFAPEVFSTVGTIPNVTALVNRATGWKCEVKEFVDNVFRTNAVEAMHLWQIYQIRTREGITEPQPDIYPLPKQPSIAQTDPNAFDGRPAALRDGGGVTCLFWHSHRVARDIARRRIWMKRLTGDDSDPVNVLEAEHDEASYIDEDPAVLFDGTNQQLFWCSNRAGSFDIWRSPVDAAGKATLPTRVTKHPAADRRPACILIGGVTWVFFESNRRGPTDIWAVNSSDGFERAQRITSSKSHDRSPSAVVDASGALRLFWSAEIGDRSRIMESTHTASGWSPASPVTGDLPLVRDESPAALMVGGALRFYWHSNRVVTSTGQVVSGHRSRIWTSSYNGTTWTEPALLSTRLSSDQEPSPLLSAAGDDVVVYMRSLQTGERFRSCTVDTASEEGKLAIRSRGLPEDRMHYTYDTRRQKEAWYARDSVGLYLTPDDPQATAYNARIVSRVRAFVASFRPVPVRFIWFMKMSLGKFEPVESDG